MCKDCGCGTALDHAHAHTHGEGHSHPHAHPHEHDHSPSHGHGAESRTLVLERKVLAQNDAIAEQNRRWLAERGIAAINMISSPGSGKTALLEQTLLRLRDRVPCAVITGDQRTDNDARRLQGRGATVRQIETINACHLAAEHVQSLLPDVTVGGVRLLFIENVGNLVCPAAFDLGENFKVALLSTTEGEDKPLKYPTLFSMAPVAVLTKMDLMPHLEWNLSVCRQNLKKINPGVFIFEVSARTGQGMDGWILYLESLAGGH